MGKINTRGTRQRGVALPVMLIILVAMLISSVYLLKSSNSSTISASNMAYDAALSKAADLGLQKGFKYLQSQAATNKVLLQTNDAANGYQATYDPTQQITDSGFWNNQVSVTSTANGSTTPDTIWYVIHRACNVAGPYDQGNACVQTTANPLASGSPVAVGDSLDANAPAYNTAPQIHYIITARIFGPRGGSVVTEMTVLIDA